MAGAPKQLEISPRVRVGSGPKRPLFIRRRRRSSSLSFFRFPEGLACKLQLESPSTTIVPSSSESAGRRGGAACIAATTTTRRADRYARAAATVRPRPQAWAVFGAVHGTTRVPRVLPKEGPKVTHFVNLSFLWQNIYSGVGRNFIESEAAAAGD